VNLVQNPSKKMKQATKIHLNCLKNFPRWQPVGGRLAAKILMMTIQVNFRCLLHVYYQMDFTSFFTMGAAHSFYSWVALDCNW